MWGHISISAPTGLGEGLVKGKLIPDHGVSVAREGATHLRPGLQEGAVLPLPHSSGSWWGCLAGRTRAGAGALWGGGHTPTLPRRRNRGDEINYASVYSWTKQNKPDKVVSTHTGHIRDIVLNEAENIEEAIRHWAKALRGVEWNKTLRDTPQFLRGVGTPADSVSTTKHHCYARIGHHHWQLLNRALGSLVAKKHRPHRHPFQLCG